MLRKYYGNIDFFVSTPFRSLQAVFYKLTPYPFFIFHGNLRMEAVPPFRTRRLIHMNVLEEERAQEAGNPGFEPEPAEEAEEDVAATDVIVLEDEAEETDERVEPDEAEEADEDEAEAASEEEPEDEPEAEG
jgi:hypothetical protein